ncbi:MAG TPA: endonuclease/exonuclease/phosphatase family protein, partial [Oxalicibacterium sp.]|nr:endonuclease/exonuclease/phosphatase family protein [Oxalicibacterium sp.]
FSLEALRHALSKTKNYRNAQAVGFDPDPSADHLTPSVALIARLPVVGNGEALTQLPHALRIALPGVQQPLMRFTRPILRACIQATAGLQIQVFVCHLKSKMPDYRVDIADEHPDQTGVAMLRSMIRRGADALGLRYLLSETNRHARMPTIVLGDFNDVATAIPTQMVMGLGKYPVDGMDERLFDSYRIQSRRDPVRDIGYTHMHDGSYETIDHILVSAEFNAALPNAIGEVTEVTYLNDHMLFKQPHASDHGQVLARIVLRESQADAETTPAPLRI